MKVLRLSATPAWDRLGIGCISLHTRSAGKLL